MSSPLREPRTIILPAVIKKRKAEPIQATPSVVRRLFPDHGNQSHHGNQSYMIHINTDDTTTNNPMPEK